MLDNFDPKEKKAFLIFFALLLLGAVYLYTHEMPWKQEHLNKNQVEEEWEKPPAKKSYDRYL